MSLSHNATCHAQHGSAKSLRRFVNLQLAGAASASALLRHLLPPVGVQRGPPPLAPAGLVQVPPAALDATACVSLAGQRLCPGRMNLITCSTVTPPLIPLSAARPCFLGPSVQLSASLILCTRSFVQPLTQHTSQQQMQHAHAIRARNCLCNCE